MAPRVDDPEQSHFLSQGTRLGVYEILSRLGAGGMGEVYRALDTKLGREVAVKVLPDTLAFDADRLARFQREAKILASLNHPGIAAIYDLQECGQLHFLVLELIPGETLAHRIASGPMAWSRALQLAVQIAEALGTAHNRGIVHRDLKPLNIMVTPGEKIKILDFGLAKGTATPNNSAERTNASTVLAEGTLPGTVLGTGAYMSPEQARGKPVDARGDVWAFGCVLFEMLSGVKVFGGETISDQIAALLVRPPDWSALPAAAPPPVKNLLAQCLEKDVERRLPSMQEAIPLLNAALASSSSTGQSIPRFGIQIKKKVLGGAAAVAILILLVLGWRAFRPPVVATSSLPDKKLLVVLPFKDLSGQRSGQQMGDGMVETLSARLARIPNVQVVMPTAAIAASDKESDPFHAARNVGANLMIEGSVQRSGNDVRITYSVWNTERRVQVAGDSLDGSASDLFGIQDRLVEDVTDSLRLSHPTPEVTTPSGLETADEQERYIRALGSLQRYDKDPMLNQALRLLQGLAKEKPRSAMVQAALGRACLYKFALTRDPKWVHEGSDACSRALQLSPNFPDVEVTLGELRTQTGHPKEAIETFQRALAIQPNNFEALLGLAAAFDASGNSQEAEATCRRAIALQPSYWAGYSRLASLYFGHGDYAHAAEMFERVTHLTPDSARAFSNLGGAYLLMGDFDKALDAYKKSLAIEPTAAAYSNIGTLQFFTDHFIEAADSFQSALRLSPDHFELWSNLGDAYRWAPALQPKASEAYARAITLCEGELRTNPRAANVHSFLALCLAKTGKMKEAEEQNRLALAMDSKNPEFLYNAAIVANLNHRTQAALNWMRRAAAAGYPLVFIQREPEFSDLHNTRAFQEVVQNNHQR